FSIGILLSYPLGWLADRFHPLRVGMVTMLIYALATLWGGLFAVNQTNFGIATVLHMILSGTILTATASLPQRLFPGSKFGQFAAASQAVLSLSTFVLALVVGPFLDYTHHVYRYTYLTASVLTIFGLVTLWIVYRQFIALGGPKQYVAPGSDQREG